MGKIMIPAETFLELLDQHNQETTFQCTELQDERNRSVQLRVAQDTGMVVDLESIHHVLNAAFHHVLNVAFATENIDA